MGEKRFNLAFFDNYDGTFSIQDTLYLKENKHLHSLDEIVDLLNEQHEDILFKIELMGSLQDAIGELKDDLNSLKEENEHLKKSVKRQQGSNNECAKLIKEQQKENEQLKSELSFWKKQAKQCPMKSCNKEVD